MATQNEETVEEDATELKFPKGNCLIDFLSLFSTLHFICLEFEVAGCDALMISEVFLLLDHRRMFLLTIYLV
jgi:hypothetical protein